MKAKLFCASFLFALLLVHFLKAQETELKKFPGQISFVPPISTSGAKSSDYIYNFSLNALVGSVGGINGVEFGGLINNNKGNLTGGQFAGLLNLNNGNAKGVQFAGLINRNSGKLVGAQFAGLLNLNKQSVLGMQFGGIMNRTPESVVGGQVAGILNSADSLTGIQIGGIASTASNVKGGQISGIASLAEDVEGMQMSGIANINDGNLKGIQIAGIMNKTKILTGFQIGLINIADSVNGGGSLGLINIYKKGFYDEWELSTADYANVKVSYKAGTSRLYTIYSVGANFIENDLWIAGIGLGHISPISARLAFQPELISLVYFPQDFKNVQYNQATHLKLGFVYNLSDKFAFSLAPSVYLRGMDTDKKNFDNQKKVSSIAPIYSRSRKHHDEKLEVGFGLSAAIILK